MSDDDARRRTVRRRLWLGLGGSSIVVAIGLVVFVVMTLKESRNACGVLLGELGALEQLTGKSLAKGHEIAGDHDCTIEVRDRAATSGPPVAIITNRHGSREGEVRRALEARPFSAREPLALSTGEGTLFVFARKAPTVTDMVDAAQAPTAPIDLGTPHHHAIVFRHGEVVTELALDSTLIDVAEARTFAAAVAARATR